VKRKALIQHVARTAGISEQQAEIAIEAVLQSESGGYKISRSGFVHVIDKPGRVRTSRTYSKGAVVVVGARRSKIQRHAVIERNMRGYWAPRRAGFGFTGNESDDGTEDPGPSVMPLSGDEND